MRFTIMIFLEHQNQALTKEHLRGIAKIFALSAITTRYVLKCVTAV